MNTRDFCYWLQGYCELTNGEYPTNAQLTLILEHAALTNDCDKSGWYNFDHFVEMFQGFFEVNGSKDVTPAHWEKIVERLQNVFTKVTSDLEDEKCEGDVEKITKEEIEEILKRMPKHPNPDPNPPPFLPPRNPFDHLPKICDPMPWEQTEIICSNGSKSDAFCASIDTTKACATVGSSLEEAYDRVQRDDELLDSMGR